jgi:hypothetical protein
MTKLEGITLFTTGVRISVLTMLLIVLWHSIKATKDRTNNLYSRLAHEPKLILSLVLILLVTSLIQVSIELYEHTGLK